MRQGVFATFKCGYAYSPIHNMTAPALTQPVVDANGPHDAYRGIEMTIDESIAADREGELQLAAAGYEGVLAAGAASLEVLVNLAVLYWQATDTGMAAARNLPPSFLATAGRRFPELLAEAERRFPTSIEPRFWRRYIAWADLAEPFGSDECRELLRADPVNLVPSMHLFALSQGREAEPEALELLRRCQESGTTRARYVASVIQGVLKRAGRR